MNRVYISLGSNMGDRCANLQQALQSLTRVPDLTLGVVSACYETSPVGYTEQDSFINSVAELRTNLSPLALLEQLQKIENDMGRIRTIRWGPRVIDLDLLLFGQETIDLPELTIPHPRMAERLFVLIPLAEIAPELIHPGGWTTRKLLEKIINSEKTSCHDRVEMVKCNCQQR